MTGAHLPADRTGGVRPTSWLAGYRAHKLKRIWGYNIFQQLSGIGIFGAWMDGCMVEFNGREETISRYINTRMESFLVLLCLIRALWRWNMGDWRLENRVRVYGYTQKDEWRMGRVD